MNRYAAFLGSINAGGDRLLMVDLRTALEREEFADIETVADSGNIVFQHDDMPCEGLAEKFAWILREEFDIDSLVVIMDRDTLAAIIAENPFAGDSDPKQLHTLLLSQQPGETQVKALAMEQAGRGPERIAAGPSCLHIDYAAGVGRSKLSADYITQRLGLRGTARTMKSMQRVLAKMKEAG